MSMQPDVDRMVANLRAALDEAEATARAAVISAHDGPGAYKPHPELTAWCYVPGGEVEYVSTPEMRRHEHFSPHRVTCDSEGLLPAVDESVGPHIALNDPARVLALVAAHREILDLYEAAAGSRDLAAEAWVMLRECVRHLASAYADRDSSDQSGSPA